jgi:DNA invertase Pin-like site-specific DNA recombinase
MTPDVLAAVARLDDEDRCRRQARGQARAEAEGCYKGQHEDVRRNAKIREMLRSGMSWSNIQAATGCRRATLAKSAKRKTAAGAGA